MNEDEIKQLIKSNKKIKFNASYKENKNEYILDPSTTGLLSKQWNNVFTLFRIDKRGNNMDKVAAYLNRVLKISNPEFIKTLNIQPV